MDCNPFALRPIRLAALFLSLSLLSQCLPQPPKASYQIWQQVNGSSTSVDPIHPTISWPMYCIPGPYTPQKSNCDRLLRNVAALPIFNQSKSTWPLGGNEFYYPEKGAADGCFLSVAADRDPPFRPPTSFSLAQVWPQVLGMYTTCIAPGKGAVGGILLQSESQIMATVGPTFQLPSAPAPFKPYPFEKHPMDCADQKFYKLRQSQEYCKALISELQSLPFYDEPRKWTGKTGWVYPLESTVTFCSMTIEGPLNPDELPEEFALSDLVSRMQDLFAACDRPGHDFSGKTAVGNSGLVQIETGWHNSPVIYNGSLWPVPDWPTTPAAVS